MDLLTKYRGFVEAVKTGSITAAAEALNYSQSGVSHMICSLEKEYGFSLLNRAKSGVALTNEGRRLYDLCVQLLEKQEQITTTVEQISGSVIGTIRIGAYYSVLMNWFPTIIEQVSHRYPQLQLQLIEGNADELFSMMRQNRIDIGILSSSAPDEYLFLPLHQDPIVTILPHGHPLSERDRLDLSDIQMYPLLVKPEHAQGILKNLLESQTEQTISNYSVRSDNAMVGLVGKGYGIGIVGEMVAQHAPDIEYRRFRGDYYRTIGVAIPTWRPVTSALKCILRIIAELYQDDEFATASVLNMLR